MIPKEEVKKIARLARIEIGENQIAKYQAELSAILDFVGQLSEVKTGPLRQSFSEASGAEPIRQITGLENVFRKDENRGLLDQTSGHELIKQAPEHREGYVAVPEVIKRDTNTRIRTNDANK